MSLDLDAIEADATYRFPRDNETIALVAEVRRLRAMEARVIEAAFNETHPCGCACEGIHAWQIRAALNPQAGAS